MKIALRNQSNNGFTLIEILVVISIIGILSGMIFTGASAAMRSAKKSSAANTAYNVRNAASAYFTEYRRQPVPENATGEDYADFATDEDFMDILLGAETNAGETKNPRGIAFYSGKAAKGRRNGVDLNSQGGGVLYDPFGRMYGVRMDTSNRGRMENPAVSEPSIGGDEEAPEWGTSRNVSSLPDNITEACAVWSAGAKLEIASDNVLTW